MFENIKNTFMVIILTIGLSIYMTYKYLIGMAVTGEIKWLKFIMACGVTVVLFCFGMLGLLWLLLELIVPVIGFQ